MKVRPFLLLFMISFVSPALLYAPCDQSASVPMDQHVAAENLRADADQTPIMETPRYLDYATFKALIALVPEAPGARLAAGLTDHGYELWSKGQMRVPAANYFVEGDFDGNGRPD